MTRALALAGSLGSLAAVASGCGTAVSPGDGGGRPDVTMSTDSAQQPLCVCCPSGSFDGRCPDPSTSGGSGDRIAPVDAGSGAAPRPVLDGGSGEAPPPSDGGSGVQPPPPPPPPEDAGIRYIDPPAGQRWCTIRDLMQPGAPSCPVPGPLPPPEG